MSQQNRKRKGKLGKFLILFLTKLLIIAIILLVPILPITDVPNCFTVVCDPQITFESIFERFN